jgi:hypothetical protein
MVSQKHLKLAKKQVRDRCGRFASPSSHTAPPPSCMQEVGRSSRHRIAPPPSGQEDVSSNDSIVEIWEVAPPPTCLEEASSNDSPSASSGYNDEWPHVKDMSSYELLLDYNYLI